ncbi:MAG: iron-containing alcohol dehydrogenase [Clostridiales bacterium]|nr:iron-containing alcohol dehydrogenase [Clostridiales bacterium]
MDLKKMIHSFDNCPCGRKHAFDLQTYKAEKGLVNKVGKELVEAGFPKKVYIVSDENAMNASKGLIQSLDKEGFDYNLKVYPDMRYARMSDSLQILSDSEGYDGIISIGTGSVNDICRYAAARASKPFAIFATAPSMDGFASDSAPLIDNNFKISYMCRQPMVVLADTEILADAPNELKAAGYGDIMAKYLAIVDWKAANYTTGEYYCEKVVDLVKKATDSVWNMTDKITSKDPEAAGSIMDALILTGCAMQLAKCTRPASGSEHVVSHYWEIHKLERGEWPDFHGKKVGLAMCELIPIYKRLLDLETIEVEPERLNLDKVLAHYSPSFRKEVIGYNVPSICNLVDIETFKNRWPDIQKSIKEDLPDEKDFIEHMKKAGCVTTIEEAHISPEFRDDAIHYSPYMRRRTTLLRLLPMINNFEY